MRVVSESDSSPQLFSDLNFDPEETSITKMSRVLSVVLPDTRLTVISNPAAIASEKYEANLAFLRNIFEQVEVQPYKDAKKKVGFDRVRVRIVE